MNKQNWKKIISFSLIMVLIVAGITGTGIVSANTGTAENTPRGKDITDYLKITSYQLMNKQEEECTQFTEGDEVLIRVGFEINPLPENRTAGDTFSITLPPNPYFAFSGTGTASDYLTYVVENNRVIFTLTEAGANQDHLVNGIFVIHGKAKMAGTGIPGGGDGRYDEVGLIVYPGENGSGNQTDDYNNNKAFPDESKALRKNGKQWNGADVIAWSGLVNYWGHSAMFTEGSVTNKTNGLLIDHLEPGTTYREGTLHISVPCYISNREGIMGERQIGEGRVNGSPQDTNFTDIVIHDEAKNDTSLRAFKRLDPAEMTYEEYVTFVRMYPEQNGGQRAYGIYTHEDGTQTVLIAFGDLPGSKHYYKDLRKDFGGAYGKIDIFDAIGLDQTLTDGQKEKMKYIYSQAGPSGGAITSYNFSFAVDVDTPNYGSGIYYNKIEFIYSEDGKEEADTETEFMTSYASIDGEFLSAKKKVDGSGVFDDTQPFYFVIEDSEGQAAVYGRTEEKIAEKGKEVEIVFYKDPAYEHPVERHDETSADHWYSLLQSGEWYYLREVDTPGYAYQVLDGRSNNPNNRFMYNKNITNLWKFLVINYEKEKEISDKITLTVHNIWEDDDDRDGKRPESVQVQLFANDIPVDEEVVVCHKDNDWVYIWKELDAEDENGEIEYTAEGIDIPKCYASSREKQKADTVIITNNYEPEKVAVEGEKTWNDNNNRAGERPDSIVVNLYADGIKVAEQLVSSEMGWKYSFSGQLKYEKGREIVYMVQESPVENYSAQYDGYNIKNDYTPGRTSRSVRKIWKDSDHVLNRPEEIAVQLYKDGRKTGNKVILDESNEWQYTWTNLPDSQNGKTIVYTVKEVAVPSDYEVSYNEDGTIILNTWQERAVKVKENDTDIGRTGGPAKTGDNARLAGYMLTMCLAAGGCLYVCVVKKKKSKKKQ